MTPAQHQPSSTAPAPDPAARSPRRLSDTFHWLLLGAALVVICSIRLRLLSFPLERDEGEYAYIGQLLLQGVPPYELAYNMKLPGTYFIYAVFMAIFGQSPAGIHLGLLLTNLASALLLFFIVRKLLDHASATFAAIAYGFLSLGLNLFGFAAHATHFVGLLALAGLYYLLLAKTTMMTKHLLLSGLLLGCSFLMKQTGVFFILLAAVYMLYLWRGYGVYTLLKNAGVFCLATLLPFVVLCVFLSAVGVFDRFWFWTFDYASKYAVGNTLAGGIASFGMVFPRIAGDFILLWLLSALGLVGLFSSHLQAKTRVFVRLLLFFSILSLCPGLYFREHYFVLLLPVVSILVAVALWQLKRLLEARSLPRLACFLPALIFVVAITSGLVHGRAYFFFSSPAQLSRLVYGSNPFPESPAIAKYIRERTGRHDTIAVLGSEPQILFYAQRRSATGYIYTYPLMEPHQYNLEMQAEMTREIAGAAPAYIVFVEIPTSWLAQPNSPRFVFSWFNSYLKGRYELDGIVDLVAPQTIYCFGADALTYRPQSDSVIYLFKKNVNSSG